jgi:2-phosphoglycerate kinase
MSKSFKVRHGKAVYPYSVGVVVESLQGAGIPTDLAILLAKDLEKSYRKENSKVIRLDALVMRLAKMVEKESGKRIAQRFRAQTPPFVPINVILKHETVPFSKEVLATYLQKLDLTEKEALALSGQVEQSLRSRGYKDIGGRELTRWAGIYLEAAYGRDLRQLFEMQQGQLSDILVLENSGESFPFSRGILAQSLMAVGLEPETAYELAKGVEDELWHRDISQIKRDDLRQVVKSLLLEAVSKESSQRYEQMHRLRLSQKPLIVLIGGAPGTGKSTLAAELAYRLGIRRLVSSDVIREALRSLVSPQLSPRLHQSSFTAWRTELLPGEDEVPGRKRVIRGYQAQAQQLSAALTAIIKRGADEAISLVIEGVHILPGILPLNSRDALIVPLILAVPDEKLHRKYFEMRDQQTNNRRKKQSYLDNFAEIRMIHDFIVERAKSEKIPVINDQDPKVALEKALEYILDMSLKAKEKG